MKSRYRLFRRGWGVYYCEDTHTGKQVSLATSHKQEAQRLVQAKNEGYQHPAFSLQLARVYWKAGDPGAGTRTWQFVMEEITKTKQDVTRHRWKTAIKDTSLDSVRGRVILETNAEHFLRVLEDGTVSTNVFLRRIHNFALDMGWLPWPVIPKKQWPPVRFGDKRAITVEEHQAIVARELNPERKAFYELAWHLGASLTDIALLETQNIDWPNRIIGYARKKTGEIASVRFDEEVEQILRSRPVTGASQIFPEVAPNPNPNLNLNPKPSTFVQASVGSGPGQRQSRLGLGLRVGVGKREREKTEMRPPVTGPLFPYLRTVRAGDRATEFKQRCRGLGIEGVSLHSYRYAWAERAKVAGYPERFAQAALGHNSKAVHRAYARKAKVILPSLASFEKQAREQNIVPFPMPQNATLHAAAVTGA